MVKKKAVVADARRQIIEELAAEINTKMGENILIKASDARKTVPRTTTGILALDLAIGGGWSANQWNEIVGEECLCPGTLILTADLTWKPVEHLTIGEELIGFDEEQGGMGKGNASKFRPSTVISLGRATLPTYEITTQYGTTLASAGHQWLVTRNTPRGAPEKRCVRRHWVRTDELAVGNPIASVGPTWMTLDSWEAGYLAGFYDGEGCLSSGNGSANNMRLSMNQAKGDTADFVEKMHVELGFQVHRAHSPRLQPHWQDQWAFSLYGRYEDMRFIGSVRPRRLLPKARVLWDGVSTKQVHSNNAIVESVRYVGEREVVTIGTSTKTLIADGLLSHNSSGKTALAYITIAAQQAADPEHLTLLVAAEEFVPEYAESFGVDRDRMWVIESNQMELALDLVIKTVDNRAVDLVVIDSLPALVTETEMGKNMNEPSVATGAQILARFFKKCTKAQRRSLVDPGDRPCTLIAINQWRDKIGVMFGDPRTTPGGKAKNYYFFVRLEVGRDEWIQEVKTDLQTRVGQTIAMRPFKNKTYRPHQRAQVDFYFADSEALGFKMGQIDFAKDIGNVALALELFDPHTQYKYKGEKVGRSKEELYQRIREDIGLRDALYAEALATIQPESMVILPEDFEPTEDELAAELEEDLK